MGIVKRIARMARDGFWPLKLGRLSEQHRRIEDAYGSLWRHKKKNKM
jgi:hypothetical protein